MQKRKRRPKRKESSLCGDSHLNVNVGDHFKDRKELHSSHVHCDIYKTIAGFLNVGISSLLLNGSSTRVYGRKFSQRRNIADFGLVIYVTFCPKHKSNEYKLEHRLWTNSYKKQYPIRIIRGSSLHSVYAPVENRWRYDGLYLIHSYEKTAYCYTLVRLKGQPPLPQPKSIEEVEPRLEEWCYLETESEEEFVNSEDSTTQDMSGEEYLSSDSENKSNIESI